MTNYRIIDKVGMPHVLAYIAARLAAYDTTRLDWIKLLPLSRKALLHGACHFPFRTPASAPAFVHGYRIRASVNVEQPPPFTYTHWARIPKPDSRRGWVSGEHEFRFADLEECALHTLAHECFHFLSDSAQLAERNTEANANWWADAWLEDFQVSARAAGPGAEAGPGKPIGAQKSATLRPVFSSIREQSRGSPR
ncbi:MAG: hypothetical protein WD928_13055 [Gammaproteobacteria bacterium]